MERVFCDLKAKKRLAGFEDDSVKRREIFRLQSEIASLVSRDALLKMTG
jgi:hypothetical protein